MDLPIIGQIIKKLRKEQNLSLPKLEKLSGVSDSYISEIESGKKNPSIEKLNQIAEGLDTDIFQILGYSDKSHKHNPIAKKVAELPAKQQLLIEELIKNFKK